jgi:hypothetical protein
MREEAIEPNRAPCVYAGWTTEITFGDTVGPSPECFRRFASRSWEEAAPGASKLRKARRRWSLIAHHVSLSDGWS